VFRTVCWWTQLSHSDAGTAAKLHCRDVTALTWVGVAIVGGLGAVARFLVDSSVGSRVGRKLPVGIFVVNVSGAFVLGLLDGLALSGNAMVIAGTAAIGAYTTFSTWMLETHRLAEEGQPVAAALNIVLSATVGFAAVAVGHLVGKHLF
jgi:CrcB protein